MPITKSDEFVVTATYQGKMDKRREQFAKDGANILGCPLCGTAGKKPLAVASR